MFVVFDLDILPLCSLSFHTDVFVAFKCGCIITTVYENKSLDLVVFFLYVVYLWCIGCTSEPCAFSDIVI